MARLYVNVDHVATVRQARRAREPDPVHAALLAELGGAAGITVHLREDRRHVQDRDVDVLRQTVRGALNLEMAATADMAAIAERVMPEQVTLVPERRAELTTEGGLDAAAQEASLAPIVRRLRDRGILVSLFVDAAAAQVRAAARTGAHAVELHTGRYANAAGAARARQLDALTEGARLAAAEGLVVHAGHGLDYLNTAPIASLPAIDELNIGHSIVSRAVLVGMERAVRDMAELIALSRSGGGRL